jgi:hypothetical protein
LLDGLQRKKALQLNGETETTVIVRGDLASADPSVLEKEFLECNANRQHQDILLIARRALRIYEIERERPRGELYSWEEGEARDRVGKAIGMSGRSWARYFRLLKGPVELQDAFRAGKVQLVVAEKVCDLDKGTQKKIADRLRAGEDAKTVVSEYMPKPRPKAGSALNRFVRDLQKARRELGNRIQEVKGGLFGTNLEELRLGRKLIDQLIGQLEHNAQESRKMLNDMGVHEEEE